jgi:hypothetical protein
MKKYSLLLTPILFCWFCSCHKNDGTLSSTAQKAMLIGKWNLQQEHFVQYIDRVKQTDTTLNASSSSISNFQFNKDASFLSAAFSESSTPGSLSGGLQVAVDTVRGTYSLSASTFNLSSPVAGFISSVPGGNTGLAPIIL